MNRIKQPKLLLLQVYFAAYGIQDAKCNSNIFMGYGTHFYKHSPQKLKDYCRNTIFKVSIDIFGQSMHLRSVGNQVKFDYRDCPLSIWKGSKMKVYAFVN